jgi:hypothetical protein
MPMKEAKEQQQFVALVGNWLSSREDLPSLIRSRYGGTVLWQELRIKACQHSAMSKLIGMELRTVSA